jgi:hypothetical protein
MNGTHGTLFCLPGLFVLCAMGYSCAGTFCRYCVIYVYQCHICVPVSYMCTSATCMYLVLSRGVRGPCTKFLVLFYIEFSVSSDAAC